MCAALRSAKIEHGCSASVFVIVCLRACSVDASDHALGLFVHHHELTLIESHCAKMAAAEAPRWPQAVQPAVPAGAGITDLPQSGGIDVSTAAAAAERWSIVEAGGPMQPPVSMSASAPAPVGGADSTVASVMEALPLGAEVGKLVQASASAKQQLASAVPDPPKDIEGNGRDQADKGKDEDKSTEASGEQTLFGQMSQQQEAMAMALLDPFE